MEQKTLHEKNEEKGRDLSRRKFIKATGVATAAFTVIPRHVLGGKGYVAPSDKIQLAHIGCGTQGFNELAPLLACPDIQITAVCDPEKDGRNYVSWFKGMVAGTIRGILNDPGWREGIDYVPGGRDVAREVVNAYYAKNRGSDNFKGVTAYADFRELLEKESIDAVKIMTPDHLHGVFSVWAMQKGINVLMHKPLSNRMSEVKKVVETAARTKAATYFMPWNSADPIDKIMQWIDEGVIGTLQEIHNWSSRPVWPQYLEIPVDRPPIPEGFDWDLWLGPESYRDYSPEYTHTVFRGWYDFGAGSIADMGHYSLWSVFNALDLDAPVSSEAFGSHACKIVDSSSRTIVNDYSFPLASTIRFTFAAKGSRPEIDLIWYDGGMKPTIVRELEEDDETLASEGMLFVGDKGKIITSFIPGNETARIIPKRKREALLGPDPVKEDTTPDYSSFFRGGMPAMMPVNTTLPKDMDKWIAACRGAEPGPGNFVQAKALAETMTLGAVALRAGRKIEYNSEKMEISNYPEANKYLVREYREGWEI